MIIETIFNQLLENQKYFNVVYPHLHTRLFPDSNIQTIFDKVKGYTEQYSTRPSVKDVRLLVSTDRDISIEKTNSIEERLKEIQSIEVSENIDLLIDETEKWVQDRTMELAILDSVDILRDGKPRGLIEEKVKKALSVSFKQQLGMEFGDPITIINQYKFYTSEDETFQCDIELLNEALGGGFRRKALYMFIGGVNVGKTLWMCHLASSFLLRGYNVVYLTAEMAENLIYHRIDANLLSMEMNTLNIDLNKKDYYDRVKKIAKKKDRGRLFVKEYPTGFGNRNHILSYLNELSIKKGFRPDIVIIDYLNIFASSRLPASASGETYHYMKSVAEEFRAIGVERDVTIISPTQLNRDSFKKNADTMDMTGQSDSFAIPATSDWMGAIIQNSELFNDNKYLLKVLKTRYAENNHEVYTVGVNRKLMRLLNVEEEDQEIPVVMRDRMALQDSRRNVLSDEERTFVFSDEMGIEDEINIEDLD